MPKWQSLEEKCVYIPSIEYYACYITMPDKCLLNAYL